MARASRGKKAGSGSAAAAGAAAASRSAPLAAAEIVADADALGRAASETGNAGQPVADLGDADPRREARVVDRPDPAPPPDHRLAGHIEEASDREIKGWAWNRHQPEKRIALDVIVGDTRLAKAMADQYRPDLQQAGIGDGRHAFAAALGEGVLPSARNVVHLRCADTGMEVPGSPVIIERSGVSVPAAGGERLVADRVEEPAAVDLPADKLPVGRRAGAAVAVTAMPQPVGEFDAEPASDTTLQWNIETAGWTGISGWIWDRQEPRKRFVLELSDGDTALTTLLANEYRADLEEAGIGDGRHGFSIAFSETLLPNARHVLHLRPEGSTSEISPFPLVLTREHAGVDATVRFILGNVAAEADRAETVEDLGPIINAMVGFLDAALSRYFYIAEEAAANVADLLHPAELSSQVRALINSIEGSYPPIVFDTGPEPLVSIVIPVFNKFELTYACVKSIAEHGAQIPFEIIIVDDCSRDETMFSAFAFGPGIRLVRNPENVGFIRSCNRGFEAARGEYIVFLNNDTEVKARWLDELYETMQRDPTIGVVGAKLLFPDGSLQECGGIIWRLGDGWNWGRGQEADDPRFCYMRDADYVSGAVLMIKADLFAQMGKFDEHFLPMYYEDTDLCFRVRQAGHRVVVQPGSEVVHFEGASGGTSVTGTGMKRFQAVNHRKFLERWKDTLASHRFNGELPELEAERNVRRRALFIDTSVPEPDKDAGSNAAFQHILSLQRLGYKVTFIPADNMARLDPYTAELQRRGIECLYHPYFFSVEDAFRKRQTPFDLVYLHRYSNASKYAGMIRQHFPKARILYSVADLHFLRMQRQAELEDDPGLREEASQLRRLELGAMSFVDCVIVHSAAEAELLGQIAPDIAVQVIPWTVPLRDISAIKAPHPAIAFIGGYNHPPNVDAAKWAAQSIMPVLRSKVPGIELLLVGSHMPKEVSSLAATDIVPLGYVPTLDSVFSRVRLTIAPLRYGAGLKGKVLESLAAGIPCVMTTVASEGLDLPGELASLVVDEPDLMAQQIATLCRDGAKYRRMVDAGKAHVAANYSSERIDSLIREAAGAE